PLPFDRSSVSYKEVSQEKMLSCSLERNAVQKECMKVKAMGRSFSSCKLPVKNSNPTEMSSKYLLETQLQKTSEDSREPDSVCHSQSFSPAITESSVLQVIAKRQNSVSTQYWGLEGFFVVGASPKQGVLEARSSLCADSSPMDSTDLFPGNGKWVTERSLSEYADDSVLESHLNRSSSALETQGRISPLTVA
ncbi:hypothetical protein N332_08645, partial [Mesitornis unicolor]